MQQITVVLIRSFLGLLLLYVLFKPRKRGMTIAGEMVSGAGGCLPAMIAGAFMVARPLIGIALALCFLIRLMLLIAQAAGS